MTPLPGMHVGAGRVACGVGRPGLVTFIGLPVRTIVVSPVKTSPPACATWSSCASVDGGSATARVCRRAFLSLTL